MKTRLQKWWHKFSWEWNNELAPYSYKVAPLFNYSNNKDQSLRILAEHFKDPKNIKVKFTYNEYDQIIKVEKL